jgi:hypothetical protein
VSGSRIMSSQEQSGAIGCRFLPQSATILRREGKSETPTPTPPGGSPRVPSAINSVHPTWNPHLALFLPVPFRVFVREKRASFCSLWGPGRVSDRGLVAFSFLSVTFLFLRERV